MIAAFKFGRVEKIIIIVGLAFCIAFPFFVRTSFPVHLMITIFMYAIMGVSWNILGSAGIVSLGQTFFYGIGGYVIGNLSIHFGINPWIGLLVAVAVNGICGLLLGNLFSRLAGHYFAIATIALAEITRTIVMNWPAVGGSVGLFLPYEKSDSFLKFQFVTNKEPYYYIIFLMFIVVILFTNNLLKTKFGFYLKAMKSSKDAAMSLGVDIKKIKTLSITISAMIATLPGAFMAQYTLYLSHETFFEFRTSLYALLVTVVGGVGCLWGPVIGAIILVPISEIFRVYLGGTGRATDLVIYGAIIMLIAVYQPKGLLGMKLFNKKKDQIQE